MRPVALAPAIAVAAAAALVGAACDRAREHREATLEYVAERSATGYGSVELGPLDAQEYESVPVILVWTGVVELGDGCVHPQAQPPILGTVRASADSFRFTPRVSFSSGVSYTACADLNGTSLEPSPINTGSAARAENQPAQQSVQTRQTLQISFQPRAQARTAPQVVSVWPPRGSVPANLLRIYVTFDQPMRRQGVAEVVRLLDADGLELPDAFVDVPDGLWDRSGQRLTLFIHPGRIKRGVGPRVAMGPVLEPGTRVRLLIDEALRSASGEAMGQATEQVFDVGPADRTSPNPTNWTVVSPVDRAGAVAVRFDESLDPAQLQRLVQVRRAADPPDPMAEDVPPGVASVGGGGLTWSFEPSQPWPPGDYQVVIHPKIEDLAGNTTLRLFDTETDLGRLKREASTPMAADQSATLIVLDFGVP